MHSTRLVFCCLLILNWNAAYAQPIGTAVMELSFEANGSVYAKHIQQSEHHTFYVRNVGPDFSFNFVALDLQIPANLMVWADYNESWPVIANCDFPPRNWCIYAGPCSNSANLAMPVATVHLIATTIIPPDTRICFTGNPVWAFGEAEGPAYWNCSDEPLLIQLIGDIGEADYPCLTLNPAGIGVENRSWSAVKALY